VQRGRGIGNLLSSFFKSFIPSLKTLGGEISSTPVVQNVLKTVKDSAKDAGINLASDIVHGNNPVDSIKSNLDLAKKKILHTLGEGEIPNEKGPLSIKKKQNLRKRKQSQNLKKIKNKKFKSKDIFD